MPNLPPGSPNWVNLSYTPTWLFTPVTTLPNTVILHNFGRNTIYVGQANVTTTTGLPIPPSTEPVRLTNVLSPLYAISAVTQGALLGTVSTAGTAGSTTQIFSTGAVAALPPGTQFIIGSTLWTSGQEVLNVATSVGTTTVSTSTPAQFAHGTTDLIFAVTPTYGQVSVRGSIL